MANLCHSRAVTDENGKTTIKDFGQFRCYAASTELIYKNTRLKRWANLEASKSETFVQDITRQIDEQGLTSIRIHSSGDFYDYSYMMKWIEIARLNPTVQFWGYTKQATFIKVLNAEANMNFVYSVGGLLDAYAVKHELFSCTVVSSEEEAEKLGLPVSCKKEHKSNDYEFIMARQSFALVIHGTQKKKK
jgi:hypothetical protein